MPSKDDLSKMDTAALVMRFRAAQKNCNMRAPEDPAFYEFWASGETDAQKDERRQDREDWCRERDRVSAALAVRREQDLEAVREAEREAQRRQVEAFGRDATLETTVQPGAPDVVAIVKADAQEVVDAVQDTRSAADRFFEKLSPVFWIKEGYDGVANALSSAYAGVSGGVGLADVQTTGTRLVGLLRLLLLLLAGAAGVYALVMVFRAAMGFGLESQRQIIKAAPDVTKLVAMGR